MASVEQIPCHHQGDGSCRFNLVVVPGTAGSTLAARTCPHFRDWLDRIVTARKGHPQIWVYNHHIRLDKIQSWDVFATAGNELLSQLLSMLNDERLRSDDKLILIGHKLGCYILKKALMEAFHKEHRPEEERLLSIVETIVMVGEPNLHPNNESQWTQLISECILSGKPLTDHLMQDRTIGALEVISSCFEDACLYCTQFDVRSGTRTKARRWKFKQNEHPGCVPRATVFVRVFTTASDEQLLEAAEGSTHICGLHAESGHSHNLRLTAGQQTSGSSTPAMLTAGQIHDGDFTLQMQASDENETAFSIKDYAPRDQEKDGQSFTTEVGQPEYHDKERQLHEGYMRIPLDQSSVRGQTLDETTLAEDMTTIPLLNSRGQGRPAILDLDSDDCNGPGNIPITGEPKVGPTSTPRRRKRKLPLSSIIPPKSQPFIGRTAQLKTIWHYFQGSRSAKLASSINTTVPKLVWIYGPSGIGKTQLALEYCSQALSQYDVVLWINASTKANLGRSYHDCAMMQGLIEGRVNQNHFESKARLLRWLESCTSRWLIVVDALDECFDDTLDLLLPRHGMGSILICSHRKPTVEPAIPIKYIEVPPLSLREGATLLRTQLFEGDKSEHGNAIILVAQRCQGFPITLRHVVDWSRRERIPIQSIEYLLAGLHVALRFGHNNVDQVLAIKRPRLPMRCGSLFDTMTFLDPDMISHRMLLSCLGETYSQPTEKAVHTAIEELWETGLCSMGTSRSYTSIHHRVASWNQSNMTDEAWTAALVRASGSLWSQWPRARKVRNVIDGFWPEFTHLHSHLQHTANACLRRGSGRIITDTGDHLKQLLHAHCWLNARLGNSDEDEELKQLSHALISKPAGGPPQMQKHVLMPRRCVQIGSDSPICVADTETMHEPYLILSWTWSHDMPDHQLTRANMTKWQKEVPISNLPTVVLDAVALGRALGFQWLWIDRYCIIQDDIDDCSSEILKMSTYFKNAALTMSHLPAENLAATFISWGCEMVTFKPYSIWGSGSTQNRKWVYQDALLSDRFLVSSNFSDTLDNLLGLAPCLPNDSTDDLQINSRHSKRPTEDVVVRKEDVNLFCGPHESERIERARNSLQDARTDLCEGSFIRASATLTSCRDRIVQLISRSEEALEVYTIATALLGTCYHLLDMDDVAGDILALLYEQHYGQPSDKDLKSNTFGHLLLALGINSLHLGNHEAAQQHLRRIRVMFPLAENEAEKIFLTAVDVSLSDIARAVGSIKESHGLLDAALEQLADLPSSLNVDAHTCRVLHRKSLLAERDGNKIRYRAAQAGMFAAYEQLQADGCQATRNDVRPVDLNQADFDALVEPWFR